MATLRRLANGLAIGLVATYPLAVYFGLQVMQPRAIGLMLLALILLRHWQSARRFIGGLTVPEWATFIGMCSLAIAIAVSNQEQLLLLYPAAVSVSLLFVFAYSLRRPPSMIERIARLSEPDLPPEGVRYTRKVTMVWCGFFLINGTVALATVFGPSEFWVLYNGLISYVLMGLLFAIEWMVRRRVKRGYQ
ncbi:hypothetical protein EGT07_00250 [Herbaspirillum sp. HC18]|nr:hypothetical protein EGT07_00250 [Herbaspirillum sp. HC18]